MNRILVCLIAVGLLASCKNDFDLIEEGNNFPVAYGFINLSDTAQYIRVERAFGEEDRNAVTLAQDPGEVFYDNVGVTLTNESTGSVFTLEKVNAANEGYTRDPGDFLVDPNFLYKIRTSELDLTGGEKVTLTITPPDDLSIATGQTTVINPISMRFPNVDNPINLAATQTRIQLKTSPEVGIIGVRYYLYVRESQTFDPTVVDTVVAVWNVSDDLPMDSMVSTQTLILETRGFYQTLANQLDKEADVIRRFSHLDIEIAYAGRELLEFRRIALANGGLSGSLELPPYTNLENGRGIFSSKRDFLAEGILVDPRTRDSLANGQITGDLNFIF